MLLETGVSSLPVIDANRRLVDVYARSDITALCFGNAYNRLQSEDVTVSVDKGHLSTGLREQCFAYNVQDGQIIPRAIAYLCHG